MSPIHDEDWAATLKDVAAAAAAEVVKTAAQAASAVAVTATNTATALAEATRIDLQYIKEDLKEIKVRLDSKYVSIEVFTPIRNVVYGLVGLILTAVVTGLLALVIAGRG